MVAVRRTGKNYSSPPAPVPLPEVGVVVPSAFLVPFFSCSSTQVMSLATNAYGQYLGDPALDPLMAYLDERHADFIA